MALKKQAGFYWHTLYTSLCILFFTAMETT